jgi:putative ABC transport system ATP-binding protein
VTGPSGSGKTSLLSILSGLAAPTAGAVYIDGAPLTGFAGPALGVSVVLQGYGLVSLLTAAENVEIALRAAGRPPRDAARAARASLAQLGLDAHADQLVEELSGGQQQRTAVARALALEPRLLIADEPTAELDPAARAIALARMFEVCRRRHRTGTRPRGGRQVRRGPGSELGGQTCRDGGAARTTAG